MEHETARLLYVATTRARNRLHLLGTVKAKEDGSIAEPPSKSLLKLLWRTVAQVFANVSRAEIAGEEPAVRSIRRVPTGWKTPRHPTRWNGRVRRSRP